jgi:hypothetical protein
MLIFIRLSLLAMVAYMLVNAWPVMLDVLGRHEWRIEIHPRSPAPIARDVWV